MSDSEISPSQIEPQVARPPVLTTSERRRLKKRRSDQGTANQRITKIVKPRKHGSVGARKLRLSSSSSAVEAEDEESVGEVESVESALSPSAMEIQKSPAKGSHKSPAKKAQKKSSPGCSGTSGVPADFIIPKIKRVTTNKYLVRTKQYNRIMNQRAQLARIMSLSNPIQKGLLKGDTRDVADISGIQSLKTAKYKPLVENWQVETTAIINEGCDLWQVLEANSIEFFFDTLSARRAQYPNLFESVKGLYEPEDW